MIHTWRRFGLPALLVCLFAVSASFAGSPELTDSKQIELIRKELGQLKKTLDDLLSVESMLAAQRVPGEIERIKERLGRLEQRVDQMTTNVDRISRSFSPPAPPVGTGTVRLLNRTGGAATVILNGTAIRLPPFASDTRTVAAGTIQYEVLADVYATNLVRASSLRPNEVLTISINNP
jgi:hypothetical protein